MDRNDHPPLFAIPGASGNEKSLGAGQGDAGCWSQDGAGSQAGNAQSRTEQAFWAMLTDISNQVDWYGQKLTPEEWKEVFTAAMKKQKVVPGIDGGFVVCGSSTKNDQA